jgi:hypothetical protein
MGSTQLGERRISSPENDSETTAEVAHCLAPAPAIDEAMNSTSCYMATDPPGFELVGRACEQYLVGVEGVRASPLIPRVGAQTWGLRLRPPA